MKYIWIYKCDIDIEPAPAIYKTKNPIIGTSFNNTVWIKKPVDDELYEALVAREKFTQPLTMENYLNHMNERRDINGNIVHVMDQSSTFNIFETENTISQPSEEDI